MDAVYFDLDGTLTDPKPGITRSIRHALDRLDIAVPEEDALTPFIGPPLRDSLRRLLGGDAQVEKAVTLYRERYAEIGLYENSVYPGIEDLLSALKANGRRLFVATSKSLPFARRIITHFGLANFFEDVFGAELDGTRENKSELLAHALAQTGSGASRSVMVGDRSHDMIGARNNAMIGLGVSYGYGSEKELREAGARDVFATPQELMRALLD